MVIFYSFLESREGKLSDIFWIGRIFVFNLSKVAYSNMALFENRLPRNFMLNLITFPIEIAKFGG